jgi:hypothetical protein
MAHDHRVDEADPTGDARRDEGRERGEDVRREEDRADDRLGDPKARVEPERHEALEDQAAGEGIEREEERQAGHDPPRPMEAEPARDRCRGPLDLDRRRDRKDDWDDQEPDGRIAEQDRSIGRELSEAGAP